MARKPLKANVKQNAEAAASVAEQLIVKPSTLKPVPANAGEIETETASYNLPLELVELCRDLAEARLKRDRAQKREARKRGEKPPQARRSASAVVAEALEAHRDAIEAELRELGG